MQFRSGFGKSLLLVKKETIVKPAKFPRIFTFRRFILTKTNYIYIYIN